MLQRGKKNGATAPSAMNGKCKVVMISSYLERPLRTLAQALEDRTRRGGPNIIGPDSAEQLVRLLTENTNRDGAIGAPAAARQRSSLDRRRAA